MKPLSRMLSLCPTTLRVEPVQKNYFETYDGGIVSVYYFSFKSMPNTIITRSSLNLVALNPTMKYSI